MTGARCAAALLLAGALRAPAQACDPLSEVPEKVQVAWLSPVRATVGAQTPMQVVRSVELQQVATALAKAGTGATGDSAAQGTAVLQALGLVGPRASADPARWKVSFFDVSRDDLCRPMAGVAGDARAGVPICEDNQQDRWHGTRGKSWTGCGYLADVKTAVRSLDVFRLRWSDAVRDGFCLLPLARLLAGRG
ncbi:MAG: hypothetical protein EXR69_02660 [Myxococcales bacterium]|nr:hypothetical protein [Myxococcales bacterium]